MRCIISPQRRLFLPNIKPFEIIILAHCLLLLLALKYLLRLEPQPVWGLTIGVPFLKLILMLIGCAAVVRAVLMWAVHGRQKAVAYLRGLMKPILAVDLTRIMIWIGLTVFGYAWLKVFVPLLNPKIFDSALYDIDNFVHFGLNPNRFLIALFPYPWFLKFLDWEYVMYHRTVFGGLCWFIVASTRSERYRFVGAYCFLWLAGSWLYVAVPSLGPCYFLPADYAEVKKYIPQIVEFQNLLIEHYFSIRQPKGHEITMAIPAFGVAAFPSLHVAAQCFLAFWARKRNRFLYVTFLVLSFFTFLASLISGWHYAVDGYAGILMAYLCVLVFEKRKPRKKGAAFDQRRNPTKVRVPTRGDLSTSVHKYDDVLGLVRKSPQSHKERKEEGPLSLAKAQSSQSV